MAIDILNIKPTSISRDLKGKYLLLYGKPKTGKTSFSKQLPNNLLLAFEKGYNALSGIKAVDINKWSELKLVLRQLEKPEAKAMYNTITIDTVSIAWDMCEQFVCAQAGVQKIGDIPWGSGYSQCKKEFESTLRKITMLGYGLLLIAHSAVRKEKTADDSEVEILSPDLSKRAYEVCNGIVDLIGYIGTEYDENAQGRQYLYTRETPTIFAGSRFHYLAPKVPFSYKNLVDAISEAIDKEQELDGATVVDTAENRNVGEEIPSYNDIRAEANALWNELVEKDEENASRILKKVEMVFSRKLKLSEITEDQTDLFYLVLLDMREMANE